MQRDPPYRRGHHARQLAQYLESDSSLAQFSAHAQKLLKLQYIFERAVPATLARYGRVANLRLGKVVIHAASGAVAAKIRQLAPRLADIFRQSGVQVNEIHIKVQPDPLAQRDQLRSVAVDLGAQAQASLETLRASLPADSPLATALRDFLARAGTPRTPGR